MLQTNKEEITKRICCVRSAMSDAGIDALIVPSSDPHISEYPTARWRGRQWLSGFTGSIGTLVVTRSEAALFTNAIYELQAASELAGTDIGMIVARDDQMSSELDWLQGKLGPDARIAIDGKALRLDIARTVEADLKTRQMCLRDDMDLLGDVWSDRPDLPDQPVFEHLPPYATQGRREKLDQVRQEMQRLGATHHLVSSTDDIAWICNLRGSDVPYNPVFASHLLITAQNCTLFVRRVKVDAELQATLAGDGVEVRDYEEVGEVLSSLGRSTRLLVDPKRTSSGIVNTARGCKLIDAINPSVFLKSRKTEADIENVRAAMEQDGAAMCEFYAWLEAALASNETVTEVTVHERLTEARSRRNTFVELSFGTIAGFNGNGAMPHYQATEASCSELKGDGMLLIDSGGQYLGGTTDITRTWPIGNPTPAMRRDYTLVLKGVIALSRQRFPTGTLSTYLDSVARGPIWNAGIDYGHGTGHGVGYFLCVHEGPHTIRKAPAEPQMAMLPGMITSIEPAIYRVGKWGVRTENLVVTVPCKTGEEAEFGDWLEFETLTLCPIDQTLIDFSLLREDEIVWLDAYHREVRRRLAPHLGGNALAWLEKKTMPRLEAGPADRHKVGELVS